METNGLNQPIGVDLSLALVWVRSITWLWLGGFAAAAQSLQVLPCTSLGLLEEPSPDAAHEAAWR